MSDTAPAAGWKLSAYSAALAVDGEGGVAYNARTGALLYLRGTAFQQVRDLEARREAGLGVPPSMEEDGLFPHLVAGGFVVDREFDELAAIEELYERERARSEFLLTILPTFGCNLGCSYCFVGRKRGTMSPKHQDRLVELVAERLQEVDPPRIAVDWFGGEPLLALPIVESLSRRLIALAEEREIPYSAQVITNGTRIDERAIHALETSRVDRLQITLDGPRSVHDRRRPAKSPSAPSPFDQTLESLDRAFGRFLIRLRINVDSENLEGAWELLELFEERGWLGPDTGFFPYLARISPFTDACASVATSVVDLDTFQAFNRRWIEGLRSAGVPTAMQGLYGFPSPKSYNCGAVGESALIFNADGEIHKCGLAVDDSTEAIGHLDTGIDWEGPNVAKWAAWSPLQNPTCRECAFLPSCLGGCPRNQMESREIQERENCSYYKEHERRILVEHVRTAGLS